MILNDYELVYLIQNEQDEIAFKYLISKYHKFIYKKIHQMFVSTQHYDDFYQEAILTLFKAVDTFDENKNKTFMRYYELILTRRLIRLKDSVKPYILFEPLTEVLQGSYDFTPPRNFIINEDAKNLNEDLILCYKLYYLKQLKPSQIAEVLNLDIKKVYNMIYSLKSKIEIV